MPSKPLQHLQNLKGRWLYVRRVPDAVKLYDNRHPLIREALGTADLREAKALRDERNLKNERLWNALRAFLNGENDVQKLHAAQVIASAMGLEIDQATDTLWKPPAVTARINESTDKLLDVVDQLHDWREGKPSATKLESMKATVGIAHRVIVPAPLHVSQLADVYCDEIKSHAWRRKSESQRKRAGTWPRRAAATFAYVVGDKPVLEVTRGDALRLQRHWNDKLGTLNPRTGEPYKADSADRCIGEMRVMLREYARWQGLYDYRNPFEGISFASPDFENEDDSGDGYPPGWLEQRFLQGEALAGLNHEARCVLFACMETGLRISECVNLLPAHILIDQPIPSILITDIRDGDDRREIKTRGSRREVPIVGVSLEAFRAYPEGWQDWRDRENNLGTAIGKFLRENGLIPTGPRDPRIPDGDQLKIRPMHSLRHSWKDRLRVAGGNEALIDYLGGWRRAGVEYGSGYPLGAKQDLLKSAAMPFDPAVLAHQ